VGPRVGLLELSVTYKDNDATVRPLAGVELRFDCNGDMGLPVIRTDTAGRPLKTDAAGHATMRASYSICRLTAQSPPVIGGRSYLWTSDVEFSRKTVRLELSSDDAIVLPVLLHDVDPEYPDALRGTGARDSVVIETVVRRDGTVGKVSVSNSTNPKLERFAIAAVRQRKYEPALKNGWPVELSLTTRIDFGVPRVSETASGSDEPVLPTNGLVLPVMVSKVEPIYPADAMRAHIEGAVALQAVLDKEGNVSEVRVLSSSDPIFIAPSIAAVKQWKYKPALQNGKPVMVYYTIRTEFRIH
jgi:protein TonB